MKLFKSVILGSLAVTGAFLFSQCEDDDPIKETVYVHDTAYGKSITGLVTYLDYNGATVAAKGAVVKLYLGNSASGNAVASTFADSSGQYTFPYLLPNNYFIHAKYNTANVNARVINGINFETNPGYAVVMGSADVTQNLTLVNYGSTGSNLLAMDTTFAGLTNYRKMNFNSHSKVTWESLYNQGNSQTIAGAFNVLQFKEFVFDEANPANTHFSGYVLMSSITTFEPARDALGTGCVQKTLRVDTLDATTPLAITDTAELYTVSVEKYGDGYLAKCRMKAFYFHGPATPQVYPADTAGVPSSVWDTKLDKPVDVYFTFEKKKVFNSTGTSYTYEFIFEGMFTFKAKTDYYVSSNNIGDAVTVKPHILFRGPNNTEY
jgi:hypothetical protein